MSKLKKWYNDAISYTKEEIGKPLVLIGKICYRLVFGSEKVTPIYSTQGTLSRGEFLIVVLLLSTMFRCVRWLNFPLVTYCAGLLLFLGLLTTIQKRCRDFGSKGTLWILILTVIMFLNYARYFIVNANTDEFWSYFAKADGILTIILLFLFFIPSKSEPDMKLRSPLLKYPLLYMVICVGLAIALTLIVNHYFLP